MSVYFCRKSNQTVWREVLHYRIIYLNFLV